MEQINQSLNKLYHQPEWPNAVAVVRELCLTLGLVMVDEPVLISDNDKINENRHRFQSAKRFNRPAVYELELDNPNIEVKLFWATKTLKTNLAWMVGITANFEDGKIFESDSYNLGIDIIIPKECDSITVLVSNNHKIRSLELKEKLSRTDLEILSKLKGLIGKSLTTVEDKKSYHNILWNAFDFEPINRKFYKELVERFGVLRSHLVSGGLDDQDAVMFTTRLIGRLLFVWFLRKKSLINEKVGYFEPQLQGSDTSYYRTKLQKLFFETLNTENDQRKPDDEKITPYLNGGLFDPSRTDFVNDDRLQFPDGYFKDFYTALSHYNFTVDESSPEFEQVAVDPEMLGKIFESLLAEQRTETGAQARKAKGAFYTPREIVSYMCEQSLEQYLLTQLNDSESKDQNLESRIKEIIGMNETTFRDQDHNKRRDWKLIKDAIIAALNNLTVFDPAVGSGAYPMGMLQLLVKVYTRLDSKYENNLSKLKRDILDRSLYGSDIDSTAIEISRLRAWLSLVVDLAADEKVTPLPNLEFHFVCANTLISLPQNKGIFDTDDLKEDLGVIRQNYYNTNSKAKKESLKKSYNQLIDSNSNKLGSVVDEILTTYQPFLHESRASFFDPDLMFGVDKFDIVIGNPPYVGEKGNKETFRPIADSPLGKRFYQGKMDLFYFFFHNALDNLRDGGIMSFVTTNYYITATGGVKLRNDMRERSTVLQLLNFGELKVFESALGQHNMITIIQKGISNTNAKTLVTQRKGYLGKDILSSVIGRTDSQTSYY